MFKKAFQITLIIPVVFSILTMFIPPTFAQTTEEIPEETPKPALTLEDLQTLSRTELMPLMERYILDELKALRTELMRTQVELTESIAEKELEVAQQAVNYSSNTVSYFFFIITSAGVLLALVGWNSLKELRNQVKTIADKEVNKLIAVYEDRLTKVESELTQKGQNIIQNQRDIEKTQKINFLWWQAELESDDNHKISLYDEILENNPEASEAYIKKSRLYIQQENYPEAIKNATAALEIIPDHSTAFYNRACAYAQMGDKERAIKELEQAIRLSENIKELASKEKYFEALQKLKRFKELIS